MNSSQKLKILEYAFNYYWGSLWWGAESFIQDRFENWHKNKRSGHPLLSLRNKQISALRDCVPMLVGTSIDKNSVSNACLPIEVTRGRMTDFGRQIESNLIFADDFIYHENSKEIFSNPCTPVWKRRRMWPNFDKQCISEYEDELLQKFLAERKSAALEQGGYN